jgi:hypothetical protein
VHAPFSYWIAAGYELIVIKTAITSYIADDRRLEEKTDAPVALA